MTGPPPERPIVQVPLCIADIFAEVTKVTAHDVEKQGKLMELVKESDQTLGFLDSFEQQLATLWIKKSKEATDASETGDIALASHLLTQVTYLYYNLDFLIYSGRQIQRDETRDWSVCEGFMLVMRDTDHEPVIDVELEDGDDEDEPERQEEAEPVKKTPTSKRKNGKTLH